MKSSMLLFGFLLPLIIMAQNDEYASYPVYTGNDLGLNYSPQQSRFCIWAPTADAAQLCLYRDATGGEPMQTIAMKKGQSGSWKASVDGDIKGQFYVFRVRVGGNWLNEVPDPYAKAVGVNGGRAMVIDLQDSHPPDWTSDRGPVLANAVDAIIYELHIRDASISKYSGIRNKGKYLGLTEKGTTNSEGLSTGLDHLTELGITHVHLLPFFDFLSVDESNMEKPQYNWGYEPLNYNCPEGSYATNAVDGVSRVRELKTLISAFHQDGLGVIMDVVYNHTMLTDKSSFNQLVPGYYYRHLPDGRFADGTSCGNETASERPMMRKFMLESLLFWINEYHVDGFRFDLMGIHDIETMNVIAAELRRARPGILLYGEGWTAGASPLPEQERAIKKYAFRLNDIAVFSDDIRDGIKGSVFVNDEKGFVSGRVGMEESIKFGVVAACSHPQVDTGKVNYSRAPYSRDPSSTVTYAECHDNHVLWDKLALSAKGASEAERKEMHKLALSIVLTAQGISFLHAGTEFLRSKNGNENSYNAGDEINAIDWSLKTKNKDVNEYVKALIGMRRQHPAFRLRTGDQIASAIRFLSSEDGIVSYTIDGKSVGDIWETILVIYNSNATGKKIGLAGGAWLRASLPGQEQSSVKQRGVVTAPAYSCSIYYRTRP